MVNREWRVQITVDSGKYIIKALFIKIGIGSFVIIKIQHFLFPPMLNS
jgi:hypothetical protein